MAYASSSGFSAQELSKLLRLVEENRVAFEEAWNEFIGR
ncbi:hypothetical protein [Meiothermus cerbereus]